MPDLGSIPSILFDGYPLHNGTSSAESGILSVCVCVYVSALITQKKIEFHKFQLGRPRKLLGHNMFLGTRNKVWETALATP